jgi:hypothetical protein
VKTGRNPRRVYDADGNEIPPVTVRQSLADGYRTAMAYCDAHNCGHGAEVPLKGWPPDLPVPDMALKLRCSKCGGGEVRMIVNVRELNAKAHGAGSTGA